MKSRTLNVCATLLFSMNQWLQVILITRMIGLYEVGLFSYFLAIVAPLVLFSRFSFSDLVPTQKRYAYGYTMFAKFRNILNDMFLVVMVGIAVFLDLTLYETSSLMLFSLFKYYETKEDFIYTENIAESNIRFLAYSKILKSILTIMLFASSVYLTGSLLVAIASLLVAQITIYHLYDRRYTHYDSFQAVLFGRVHFRNIFWLGLGLSLVGLLSSLNTNIPRYILEHYHSVEILGIYATIMYFAAIALNIVITINQSLIADFAKAAARSLAAFRRAFLKLMGLYLITLIIGNVILILYGNDILVFVYGEQFEGYQKEMLLLGMFISLIVVEKTLEMALNIFNFYNIQLVLQGFNFVFSVLLSVLLIIPFGITGAFTVAILSALLVVFGQVAALLYARKHRIGPGGVK
ncbi:oligosaccharide flippase family protein [Salinicoccus roseus]|uniref:oligosaccharide flippase family protein n=1 Tax=Salinicoccus roseus TaxID=45670 RepID=UPI002300E290|nr:oligosaccharide flippase family protein [Salinicoccus roseus]